MVPVIRKGGGGIAHFDECLDYLPRARTCTATLYLPVFASRKQLHDSLWPIVDQELEHKGYTEWSGV